MSADEGRGSRVLRGILDACLLSLVAERDRYGYELATALHDAGLPIVKEGSIYPLLARLEKRALLDSYRVPGEGAPPRRYYRLTPAGRAELATATAVWDHVASGVDAVLHRDRGAAIRADDDAEASRDAEASGSSHRPTGERAPW